MPSHRVSPPRTSATFPLSGGTASLRTLIVVNLEARIWTRDFKWVASQKSRHIKHFAGMHRNCAAVGMVHRSGEDMPIFDGYDFRLEEAIFAVK